MKRIGVLTGGGDAPGLNSAIKSVVYRAENLGIETIAIYEGWKGLLDEHFEEHLPLDYTIVRTWDRAGGTNIGTSRTNPFSVEKDGAIVDCSNEIVRNLVSSVDPAEIYTALIGKIMSGLRATAGILAFSDPKGEQLSIERVEPEDRLRKLREPIPIGKGIMAAVFSTGKVIIENKAAENPEVDKASDFLPGLEVRNLAVTPIKANGKVLGVFFRDQHLGDTAAQCRQQFFLEATDGQDPATKRDFTGHGHFPPDRNTGQDRGNRGHHGDTCRRAVFWRCTFRHVHVDVLLVEHRRFDADVGRTRPHIG